MFKIFPIVTGMESRLIEHVCSLARPQAADILPALWLRRGFRSGREIRH